MVEHVGVEPTVSGPPDRRASDAPVLDEMVAAGGVEPPTAGYEPAASPIGFAAEGSLGIEPSPAISKTALCACTPHDGDPGGTRPHFVQGCNLVLRLLQPRDHEWMGSEESNLG